MSKLVGPGGRVFAFEAVPENAKLVGENVALNGYDGLAKVENLAVSDGLQRHIALYRGPSSFEATIMLRGWEVMMEIPAVALDDYFQPGERIDFIKMDIEGGEVKALPGMARILKETRPLLLIEIHDIGLPAVDFLLKIGYRFQDLNRRPLDDSEVARGLFNHCIATPPEK
jgi:FkbM family methyltransferase